MAKKKTKKTKKLSAKLTKGVTSLEEQVKVLTEKLEQQTEVLDRTRKAKFKLPTGRKTKSGKGSFIRLIVPDTHGCRVDEGAIGAFLGDLESLAPAVKEIIYMGDHVDNDGFLSQHHVLGYIAQTEYSVEDDLAAANTLLDRIQTLCPEAPLDYLEGNHERRVQTWIMSQVQRHKADGEWLRRLHSPINTLHLDKRGIKLYEQGIRYDDCRVPATIKRGHCYFTHGSRHGKNVAAQVLGDYGANVVFAHVHRAMQASTRMVDNGELHAWCCGCLCELQPVWKHSQPTEWNHGYGIQFAQESGDFLHLNIPILDGKSFLVPLINLLEAN